MVQKGEIVLEQFHLFSHTVFYSICILNPLKATFQLSSTSLNLGRSQNSVVKTIYPSLHSDHNHLAGYLDFSADASV